MRAHRCLLALSSLAMVLSLAACHSAQETIGHAPGQLSVPGELLTSHSECRNRLEAPSDQLSEDLLCGEDDLEVRYENGVLSVFHRNATYNCCLDGFAIRAQVDRQGQQTILRLEEDELLTDPCLCRCCYDIGGGVRVDLPTGVYTIELCWLDSERNEPRCLSEELTVEG